MRERSTTWNHDAAGLLRRWQDRPSHGLSAKLNAALSYEEADAYGRAIEKALPALQRQFEATRDALQYACDELAAAEAGWRTARTARSRRPGGALAAYVAGQERMAREALALAQQTRNDAAAAAWQAEQRLAMMRNQLEAVRGLAGDGPLTVLVLEVRR